MTLGTGSKLTQRISGKGFSLVEIVLVLGLIAIASSIVIANFASFANKTDSISSEEALLEAVRFARFTAAKNQSISELYFDAATGSLIVEDNSQNAETFKLGKGFGPDLNGVITFYLIEPAEGFEPFDDRSKSRFELRRVQFDADRSSTPFNALIKEGLGSEQTISFDPFSHFPMLQNES
tara:strand:- start:1119 stop:1658 length:540 start_codon:yes stop_codon:yes gene_type:complete